jgi:hypothetical protein
MRHQRSDQDGDAEQVEEPDDPQEPDHDLTPVVVLHQPGEAEQQYREEGDVGPCDDEPDPPELVSEQLPVGVPTYQGEQDERAGGGECEGCRVVPRLPGGLEQAGRIRMRLRRFGRVRHRGPGCRARRTSGGR